MTNKIKSSSTSSNNATTLYTYVLTSAMDLPHVHVVLLAFQDYTLARGQQNNISQPFLGQHSLATEIIIGKYIV